jgi:hypothetical protein
MGIVRPLWVLGLVDWGKGKTTIAVEAATDSIQQ